MKCTTEWKKELAEGIWDERLAELYVSEKLIPVQRARYISLIESFEKRFGAKEVVLFSAPGRSEIAGNHTDHQQGEVLAASVNLDAVAVVAPTYDGSIRILSLGYSEIELEAEDTECRAEEEGTSIGLVRGMCAGMKQQGYPAGGFEACVTSDVLNGAGLSSSAAFEVLIGHIISGLYHESQADAVLIAQVAQYAENVYFGKPCGLMDQTACSVGGMIHIDFADKEHPMVKKVPVDFSAYGHSLCIVDTKGSHADLTDEYAAIPAEMKAIAAEFGKAVLREVPEQEVYGRMAELREKLGDRPVLRAMHFFAEDRRVEAQVEALKQGEFQHFLSLVQESGNSSFRFLQNVYTSKDVQNQSMSVALAVSECLLAGGHGVCRVHGGGFAGTIQAFVEDSYVEVYRKGMDAVFGEGACHVLKVRPVGGVVCFK